MAKKKTEAPELPTKAKLTKLRKLVQAQMDLEDEVKESEESLKDTKQQLLVVSQTTIPEYMAVLGFASLTLDDGSAVKLMPYVMAKSTEEGLDWLIDHGHEDLVKHDITVHYTKGEDAKAKELLAAIKKLGRVSDAKTHVHNSTLKAFIKEEVENGRDIPLALFDDASVGQVAKITRP